MRTYHFASGATSALCCAAALACCYSSNFPRLDGRLPQIIGQGRAGQGAAKKPKTNEIELKAEVIIYRNKKKNNSF
jgi:hypothetical protein